MTQILLLIHITGAALLIGGVVASVVWMREVAREGDAKVAAFGLRAIRRLNLWSLHGGAALVLLSGFWLAVGRSVPLRLSHNPWLLYSLLLLFVVLSLALGIQAPILTRLAWLSESAKSDFAKTLAAVAGRWTLLSLVNFALLLLILAFMIFKP